MKSIFAAVVALGLAFSAQADVFVDGDAEAGKTKAAMCGACHGADGNASVAVNPKLAGQNASYIVAQLTHFKSGERQNPIMQGMAAGLSEQDMADIAVFYSAQTVKVGAASETLWARGQDIYRGGITEMGVPACTGCHGPQGEGNPGAQFPALTGQNAAYTEAQLFAYRKEARTNPKAEIMVGVSRGLSDKDIKAVADYLQGLH